MCVYVSKKAVLSVNITNNKSGSTNLNDFFKVASLNKFLDYHPALLVLPGANQTLKRLFCSGPKQDSDAV